jgi:diadenosine tetraphosphate (Ap4A) HIT family hydrolase
MTDAAHRLAEAIRRTDLKCDGFNLLMNTGKAADQTVFHAHLHIITRYVGEPPEKRPADKVPFPELETVAGKIRTQLAASN